MSYKGVANIVCDNCRHPRADKGRAVDGRRAYRCRNCRTVWTRGLQGRARQYNEQRRGVQFADTGSLGYRTQERRDY